MAEVIQDSDDEDNVLLLSPIGVAGGRVSPSYLSEPSVAPFRGLQLTGGASSTENLKHEIQLAQETLVQPRPREKRSLHRQPEYIDPVESLGMVRAKRRKTVEADAGNSPIQKPTRSKSVRTYGSSNYDFLQSLSEDSRSWGVAGDPASSDTKPSHKSPKAEAEGLLSQSTTASPPKTVGPVRQQPGHTRKMLSGDFLQHEPNEMFPEPSSTVLNHTATQERFLTKALENNTQESDTGLVLTSECLAIPHSAKSEEATPARVRDPGSLSTKSISSESKVSFQSSYKHDSSGQDHEIPPPVEKPSKIYNELSAYWPSLAGRVTSTAVDSVQGSSEEVGPGDPQPKAGKLKSIKRSRDRDDLQPDLSDQNSITATPTVPGISAARKVRSKSSVHEHESELSPTISKSRKSVSIKSTKEARASQDLLDANDVAVGLPKERYVPRPSRSRSVRQTQAELVDYTVPPEKIANEKKRRSKTTKEPSFRAIVSEAEDLRITGDQPTSDEISIGLPKERYVPRPSRSRALRPTEGADHSQTAEPEKPPRESKRRRTNTRATTNEPDNLSDVQKLSKIEDMGFSSSQADKALKLSDGVLEDAVESLIVNGPPNIGLDPEPRPEDCSPGGSCAAQIEPSPAAVHRDDEQAISLQPSSNNGLPHIPGAHVDKAHAESEEQPTKLLHVEIPTKAKAEPTAPKMPARRKRAKTTPHLSSNRATSDLGDFEDSLQYNVSVVVQRSETYVPEGKRQKTDVPEKDVELASKHTDASAPSTKKRGRGRPRSTRNRIAEDVEVHEGDATRQPASPTRRETHPNTEDRVAALNDIEPNSQHAPQVSVQNSEMTPAPGGASTGASDLRTPSPRKNDDEKGAPRASPISNSLKHSPLNKGKVSYRVGLSRRNKIPSLLRVVKK